MNESAEQIDVCVILPSGEVACSWKDVENVSFLDIYTQRTLQMICTYRRTTIFDRLIYCYKVRNLYKHILVHDNWLTLLTNDFLSWKDQKRIASTTPLCEFEQYGIMYQAEKLGYRYSEYHKKIFPKDVDKSQLPSLIYLDDYNTPHIWGNTTYKSSFLKMAMLDQSNTIYIQVITHGESWHCFFSASKGILKKESGKKSHIHYVSNKLGLQLEQVINEILANHYLRDKAHINNYTLDVPTYL